MIDNLEICMQFRNLRLKPFFLVTMVNYRTREGGHWLRAHPHDTDELKFK